MDFLISGMDISSSHMEKENYTSVSHKLHQY